MNLRALSHANVFGLLVWVVMIVLCACSFLTSYFDPDAALCVFIDPDAVLCVSSVPMCVY